MKVHTRTSRIIILTTVQYTITSEAYFENNLSQIFGYYFVWYFGDRVLGHNKISQKFQMIALSCKLPEIREIYLFYELQWA